MTPSAVEVNDGLVVSTEGDSFFAVFPAAPAALRAAVEAQLALERHPWPDDARIRVRMGLHTGAPMTTAEGYVGIDVHRGARVGALARTADSVAAAPVSRRTRLAGS